MSNGPENLLRACGRLATSTVRFTERLVTKTLGKERHELAAELAKARVLGELAVNAATAKLQAKLNPPAETTTTPPLATVAFTASIPSWIPDYDELTASQIVALLVGRSEAEIAEVRAYELEHRARPSIAKATKPGA